MDSLKDLKVTAIKSESTKAGETTSLDFKAFYKVSVIPTAWCMNTHTHKHTHTHTDHTHTHTHTHMHTHTDTHQRDR
jgi:hypothetical protein